MSKKLIVALHVFALALMLIAAPSAFAADQADTAGQAKGKETTKPNDALFGEDGSYNVSVSGGGVQVHGEYDKDGKPKSGEGQAGSQAVEAVDRGFHDQRKSDRRERKAEQREQKKKAKEARR